MSLVRAVIKHPGKLPTIEMAENTADAIRKIVDGPLELVTIDAARGLYFYCNGDYQRSCGDLERNFRIAEDNVLMGSVIAFKLGQAGEDTGLSEEEAEHVRGIFFDAGRALAYEDLVRKSPALALGLGLFNAASGTTRVPRSPFIPKTMPPDNGRGR